MDPLSSIWTTLAGNYTLDQELTEKLWSEIDQCYSSKHRHYHNLDHLQYMIGKTIAHWEELENFDTLQFSIFYHDIVYRSTRKDNEERSANYAVQRLTQLGVPEEQVLRCRSQILATKHHRDTGDNDTNYLLDFDLAILGDSPDKYLEYTRSIRREYAIYPDFLYRKGRKKVLQHFLEMPRIFKTTIFYEKLEKQARENLQTELESL